MTQEHLTSIPDTADELLHHSMEDFNSTVETIVGAPAEVGSNEWKITDLKNLIQRRGSYKRVKDSFGAKNQLNVEHMQSRHDSPEGAAYKMSVNRAVLDTLYEHHGVDFEGADIVEIQQPHSDVLERVITYPTNEGFLFTEKYLFDALKDPKGTSTPAFFVAEIIAAK